MSELCERMVRIWTEQKHLGSYIVDLPLRLPLRFLAGIVYLLLLLPLPVSSREVRLQVSTLEFAALLAAYLAGPGPNKGE